MNKQLPGLAPTHFCKVCGALWRQCDDGSWNLRSEKAGPCCDNVPMGEQIEPLASPARVEGSDGGDAATSDASGL